MNILFLGPPGSGKGTQAKKLSEKLEYYYLSTGQMFRSMKKQRPELAEYLDKGLLIPDDIVVKTLKEYLDKKNKYNEIILDGTPRSIYQFKKLQEWLESKGSGFKHAVFIDISQDEATKRLTARRTHKVTGEVYNLITNPPGPEVSHNDLYQREDDEPEVIKKRFEEYREDTEPLVDYLDSLGILIKVNGERPIKEILDDISARLKSNK